jgi:hypothetical protein
MQGIVDGIQIESYPVLEKSVQKKLRFLKRFVTHLSRIVLFAQNQLLFLQQENISRREK